MSFDFSTFSASQRRIAHQAGRSDGDAQRDADWIEVVLNILGSQFGGLNQYPMTRYTSDGSGIVTDANFVATFNATLAAAVAGRGIVVIPSGTYNLTQELDCSIADFRLGQIVAIVGAGAGPTTLSWPSGYTGNGIKLSGSESPYPLHNGLIANIFLAGNGCSGKAIAMDALVSFLFVQVFAEIWDGVGGAGLYNRLGATPDDSTQDCTFINCGFAFNYNGVDTQFLTNGRFINCYLSGTHRSLIVDQSRLTLWGCNFQAGVDVVIEASGQGGCYLDIEDAYFEGNPNGVLLLGNPSVTQSHISVRRFRCPSTPLFCDIQGPNIQVTLDQIIDPKNCTVFIKARNANKPITVTAPDLDYATNTSKFDMDAASAACMFYQNAGTVRAGTTYVLPGFAEGSEPATEDQALIFNTTTSRLRFRTGGSWSDVSAGAPSIYEILAPYAIEIWDIGVTGTLQSLTTPTTWTGLKAATVLNNGIVGKSPDVAASQRFRNQFGATCTYDAGGVNSKFWKGTLSPGVISGKWPGAFVVFSASTTGIAGNERTVVEIKGTETFKVSFADSISGTGNVTTTYRGFGIASSVVSTTATIPHVSYSGFSSSNNLQGQLDGSSVFSGSSLAAASTAMTSIAVGGRSGDNLGGDVTVLFLAIFNVTVPASVVLNAQKVAKQIYGIA